MKQVFVSDTPVLLSAAGNRDFLHVRNNGSETIFLCYDGQQAVDADEVTIDKLSNFTNAGSVNEIALDDSDPTLLAQLQVGMTITGTGIPDDVGVQVLQINGSGIVCTNFTANATVIGGSVTFGPALTVNTGFPLPANEWVGLGTDGTKSILNKAVWAVAAAGPVDVRLQGE